MEHFICWRCQAANILLRFHCSFQVPGCVEIVFKSRDVCFCCGVSHKDGSSPTTKPSKFHSCVLFWCRRPESSGFPCSSSGKAETYRQDKNINFTKGYGLNNLDISCISSKVIFISQKRRMKSLYFHDAFTVTTAKHECNCFTSGIFMQSLQRE